MKSKIQSLALAALAVAASLPVGAQSPLPPAPVSPQAPAARAAMLGSAFFDWDKLPMKTTPVGISRPVVDAPTPTLERFECHVTTLHPGYQSHPPHHHPQEELILLREGTLESSINGKRERIGAGSLLFFASHDVHNMTNVGDRPATYYVINFHTAATASVRNQPAAEWAPADKLRSSVFDWEKRVPKTSATDTRYYIVDSPTLTFARLAVHATTMNPGAPPSKAHHHPWLELIVMMEGTMEMTVDGATHAVGPGSIAYLASNALQSMRNPGAVPATYYVFAVSSAATPKAVE